MWRNSTACEKMHEVYAAYETSEKLEDKKLHKLIDNLNLDLRVSKNREFFIMSPEETYELLETIATISGSQDKLKRMKPSSNVTTQKAKRPAINFAKCGIPVDASFVFIEDASVRVIVESDRKVVYNNEITSLAAVVGRIKGVKAIQGPAYFTYNGKTIPKIAEETQWKNQ